jgi:tetratricopeptide (TPR) repeat protein
MDERGPEGLPQNSNPITGHQAQQEESTATGDTQADWQAARVQYVRKLGLWVARPLAPVLLDVLLARDRVDQSLENVVLDPTNVLSLSEPDEGLRTKLASLDDKQLDQIKSWRTSLKVPSDRWWWWAGDDSSENALLPLFSGFCIAFTLAIIADVARKILIGNTDTAALFTIFLQVALALLATSAYSDAGGKLLDKLLTQANVSKRIREIAKPVIALLVLLVALASNLLLPRMGHYYYQRAMGERDTGRFLSAQQHLALAASINSDDAAVHYATGAAKEDIADIDGALTEYRIAIKLDATYDPARVNLATLLLATKADAPGALAVLQPTEERADSKQMHPDLLYSLYKDIGWAYYILKANDLARTELVKASGYRADAPAPNCLLAKIDLAENKPKDAKRDFNACLGKAHLATGSAEAGWVAEAQSYVRSHWQ